MRAEDGFSTLDAEHEPGGIIGIRIVEHANVRHKLDRGCKVLKRLVKAWGPAHKMRHGADINARLS